MRHEAFRMAGETDRTVARNPPTPEGMSLEYSATPPDRRDAERSRCVLDARSRPTARSSASHACSRAPRTCTTSPPMAAVSWTRWPACGAPMPATAGPRLWKRSRNRPRRYDYAPPFQFGHPQAFELASRIAALAPKGLEHVFFCNSGSEAVDTALKVALAYHNGRGEAGRTRLLGPRAAAITASASAASRSAAWSTTARLSAHC